MKSSNLSFYKKLVLIALIPLLTGACVKIVGDRNYTLGEGGTIR
jgi:hypothetical protein